jgi:hypothetical protein|tara:strand:- start:311 stop:559 length:249 start_codon:yes stop_codon:yes gene_type:complete
VKVLLTIDGGFAKTIFEGIDKGAVEWFLKGFQYARKMNLESPEVIGVLNELIRLTESDNYVYWSAGALAAIQNSKGKLEVVE